VLATPLQIANLCSTIANRGYFYTPHVVKEIAGGALDSIYYVKHHPKIKKEYYEDVAEGMRMAVLGGTCRGANLPGIEVAGKTGTAQNPHGRDHSAFMGFAPYNNPKIAVAVYVENAGFGAAFGVPIGSLIIEKYLNGEISSARKGVEERMLNSNTIASSGVKKH
ncbi:MAG: penicillin-binding protein 2, partial [Muribaculaceae bacterium]|nr:penicillin-binding protein 2 [Muribaculaceae bacterium]